MNGDEQSRIEDASGGRRSFLKATGLATVALGAELGASRSLAQAPSSAAKAPAQDFHEGIETPDKLANFTGALLARGYKEQDVAKIWGGNWLRVMKEV